jgi:hypothetical protein
LNNLNKVEQNTNKSTNKLTMEVYQIIKRRTLKFLKILS